MKSQGMPKLAKKTSPGQTETSRSCPAGVQNGLTLKAMDGPVAEACGKLPEVPSGLAG